MQQHMSAKFVLGPSWDIELDIFMIGPTRLYIAPDEHSTVRSTFLRTELTHKDCAIRCTLTHACGILTAHPL